MRHGVALFLLREDGKVFAVREKKNKPEIGKNAGMLSIPMETLNPGEDHASALGRLVAEEIGLNQALIAPQELDWAQFEPVSDPCGIPYRILPYVAVIASQEAPMLPTDSDDVEPAGWRSLAEIMAWSPPFARREMPALIELLLRFWGG